MLPFCQRTKKLLNMRVMTVSVAIGALGRVLKGLKKRLEELENRRRIQTIETKALLKSTKILRRVL